MIFDQVNPVYNLPYLSLTTSWGKKMGVSPIAQIGNLKEIRSSKPTFCVGVYVWYMTPLLQLTLKSVVFYLSYID